jgi:hypothetical protein
MESRPMEVVGGSGLSVDGARSQHAFCVCHVVALFPDQSAGRSLSTAPTTASSSLAAPLSRAVESAARGSLVSMSMNLRSAISR